MDETENVIKTLPFQVRYIRAAATEGGSLYWGSDLWTGLIWEKATERPHVFSVSALNTTRSSAYTWTRTDPHFPRCLSFFLFSSTLWNTLIYIWSCLLKAVVSPRCGGVGVGGRWGLKGHQIYNHWPQFHTFSVFLAIVETLTKTLFSVELELRVWWNITGYRRKYRVHAAGCLYLFSLLKCLR